MGDEGKDILVLRPSLSPLIAQGCLAHAISHGRGPEGTNKNASNVTGIRVSEIEA